jgi:hypothetical protein
MDPKGQCPSFQALLKVASHFKDNQMSALKEVKKTAKR